jgi:hypothetical protein
MRSGWEWLVEALALPEGLLIAGRPRLKGLLGPGNACRVATRYDKTAESFS